MEFSVLMPVYYKENPNYLALALRSILVDQSILPNEVIIVEDGELSNDLYQVLDEYSGLFLDKIVRIRLKENKGMGVAMNYGLRAAKYPWIARMDSDDVSHPERFFIQVNFLKDNPKITVLGSSIEEFNFEIGDLKRFRIMPQLNNDIIKMMKFRNPLNHMSAFFNKEIAILSGGYWDKRFFEDYNLWYEILKQGGVFHNLQNVLVYSRVGNDMVSRRSGYNYYRYERILLGKFKAENFINRFEYYYLNLVKFILRVLPVQVLKFIYQNYLRNRDSPFNKIRNK